PFAKELDSISFQEWIDSQDLPRWIVEMWKTATHGIISSNARDVSLLFWLWYCASNLGLMAIANDFEGCPQEWSLEGGLGTLVERYAKSLTCEVRTSAPVAAIDHGSPDRVRVTLRDGETLTARHVVVAATPRAVGKHV